jgi:branched-chain amino acid transport system ATP-binding protein
MNLSECMLEAKDITVRFGGLKALESVSLTVPENTITGLIGPNGAGKSTLFDVLSGFRTPSTGQVLLNGTDVTNLSVRKRSRLGMSRSFQHPELFSSLTIREHVLLAYRTRYRPSKQWTDFISGAAFRRADRHEAERVDHVLAMLRLYSMSDMPVSGLPLGTCRLVEVARAVATSPKIVLLDEPASGLSTEERAELSQALADLVADSSVSILLVEHDIDMVMRLSHQVFVLNFGLNIASGSPKEVRENPAVQDAYLGDLNDHLSTS